MATISTPRLLLREFTPDDIDALAPILADPAVMRFSLSGPETREQTAAFVTWCQEQYAWSGFGLWALIHIGDGQLIGYCGLSEWEIDGAHEVEVGYRLDPHYWGQGLATEAAQAALAYGCDHLGLRRVIAIIEAANVASVRVAEKLGMRWEKETVLHDIPVRIYAIGRQVDSNAACTDTIPPSEIVCVASES